MPVPVPLLLLVIFSQLDALLLAVHAQGPLGATVTLPLVAVTPIVAPAGVRLNEPLPVGCVTLQVKPATVKVPVREVQ